MVYTKQTLVAPCWERTSTCSTTRGHPETAYEVGWPTTGPPIPLKKLWQHFDFKLWIIIQNQTNCIFEPLEWFICGPPHKRLISSWQYCVALMNQWTMFDSQQQGTPLHKRVVGTGKYVQYINTGKWPGLTNTVTVRSLFYMYFLGEYCNVLVHWVPL